MQAKIADAWTPDFAARASTWLSEAEDKMRDIEDWMRRREGWIVEDEAKLRGR